MVARGDHAVAPEVGPRELAGALVSASALSNPEVSELSADVSHLLATEEVENPGLGGTCVTLCGEIVRVGSASVLSTEHCPSCDCVPLLCPECVRKACEWSAESS